MTTNSKWFPHVPLVHMAAMVPLFLLVISPGDGVEGSEACPLVKNGRMAECTAMANKAFSYTDHQQLYHACKHAELQAWPQCLKRIVEECRDLGFGDPELHNATLFWKNKFDKMCDTVVELHQSRGTASFISSSSSDWHTPTCLPLLAFVLLGFCLPAL
ncbi:uncharacterized protein LOC143299884 [Babylonia areolata]|uniref:uncharacterized protein LOC143299884 n=1 Tax=Babylonia areolata TaxID=304850 RepID=UPI003FD0B318